MISASKSSGRASRSVRSIVAVAVIGAGMLAASPVSATAPEQLGPNFYDVTFIGFDCGDFDIEIASQGSDRLTVFFDAAGDITRLTYYARFPRDVMTNTVTGRSIVVRGEFQQTLAPIPGTDDFSVTIVGFRYLVNQPGLGATIREVGRITYAQAEELLITFQAGHHDLAVDEDLGPVFCGALA